MLAEYGIKGETHGRNTGYFSVDSVAICHDFGLSLAARMRRKASLRNSHEKRIFWH
jgi:hypothetical protein